MENSGWIKIHRRTLDNPWFRRPAYRAVWLELLLRASHKPTDVIWKGKRITLEPGQMTCGAKQLSEWTGVPRTTVERVLECLKSGEQIGEQTSNKFRLITIKNWGSYQKSGEDDGEQMGNKWETNGKQMDTLKECKNVRNIIDKKEINKEKDFSESHPSFVRLSELCITLGLVNSVNAKLYLETLLEYMNKINTVQEMRDCLYWCKDHGVRSVNIQRIRNWFKKAKEFQKVDELRRATSFKDQIHTQDSVKMQKNG